MSESAKIEQVKLGDLHQLDMILVLSIQDCCNYLDAATGDDDDDCGRAIVARRPYESERREGDGGQVCCRDNVCVCVRGVCVFAQSRRDGAEMARDEDRRKRSDIDQSTTASEIETRSDGVRYTAESAQAPHRQLCSVAVESLQSVCLQ